jgi:hypothetical protein
VRISRVILSVLSLLWGFLQAPFDHIHPEELEHQATTGPVHLHVHETLAGHGTYIAAHTADDDEIDVQWSVTTTAQVELHADIGLAERVSLPDPSSVSTVVVIPWRRGHDPPEFSPKIPRAPPA